MIENGEVVLYSWLSTRPRTAVPAAKLDRPFAAPPGASIPDVGGKRIHISYAWRCRTKSRIPECGLDWLDNYAYASKWWPRRVSGTSRRPVTSFYDSEGA